MLHAYRPEEHLQRQQIRPPSPQQLEGVGFEVGQEMLQYDRCDQVLTAVWDTSLLAIATIQMTRSKTYLVGQIPDSEAGEACTGPFERSAQSVVVDQSMLTGVKMCT